MRGHWQCLGADRYPAYVLKRCRAMAACLRFRTSALPGRQYAAHLRLASGDARGKANALFAPHPPSGDGLCYTVGRLRLGRDQL
jgi:hypothetical protein